MADFDLTQTDQQVQNILNDGQSAMGAGAQTTLTTEYVMLKDTNGVYHKILKNSLTEACRNVLADLLVNNDKGTTISQIPAIASGDFGSVTPANLASVLGGVVETIPQNTDLNDLKTRGKKYISPSGSNSATLLNLPNEDVASAGFELEYFTGYYNGTFGTQILYNHVNTFIRRQHLSNGTVFGNWYIIKQESVQ